MQEYKGVITGIGEKLTGENLIQPQLDAYWRNFVIGGNAILNGFEIVASQPTSISQAVSAMTGDTSIVDDTNGTVYFAKVTLDVGIGTVTDLQASPTSAMTLSASADYNPLTGVIVVTMTSKNSKSLVKARVTGKFQALSAKELTSGACQALGYVGYMAEDLPVDTNYVYGHFVINHSDEADEFSIVTSDTEINQQDDILNEAGEYYLLLYSKGDEEYTRNTDLLLHPAEAIHSEESDKIVAGGTIASDCVAVTQKVDDDSDKVATTQYVANQIKKDIDETPINQTATASIPPTEVGYQSYRLTATTTIQGKSKAKIVHIKQLDINITSPMSNVTLTIAANTVFATLEDSKFFPNENINLVNNWVIDTQGRIYRTIATSVSVAGLHAGFTNIGYETK